MKVKYIILLMFLLLIKGCTYTESKEDFLTQKIISDDSTVARNSIQIHAIKPWDDKNIALFTYNSTTPDGQSPVYNIGMGILIRSDGQWKVDESRVIGIDPKPPTLYYGNENVGTKMIFFGQVIEPTVGTTATITTDSGFHYLAPIEDTMFYAPLPQSTKAISITILDGTGSIVYSENAVPKQR